jgi:tetratricopeptide (TPR) repeat protein
MRQGFPRRLSRTLGGLVLLMAPEFLSSRSAQAQQAQEMQTRSVSGQVVTEDDAIITSGVTIIVQSRDGSPVAEVHADSQGRFEVPNLSRETYLLTVSAQGFFPLQHTLDFRGGGVEPVTLRLVLTRASLVKTTSPLPALTDMSAPKEARKAYKSAVGDLQAGRVDDARSKFERAVAEYPCYARALAGLATIQMAERHLDDAATNLRQAIHCDPGFPGAFTSLGQLLNSQLKFVESEEILKQGLRLSPQAWQLYDQLATAHYNEGQYGEAQEEWLRVLSLEPAAPAEVHAKLAAVYLREGAPDKSYAEMQAYLQAAPNGRFASQFKALMPRLRPSDAHGAASPLPEPPASPNP